MKFQSFLLLSAVVAVVAVGCFSPVNEAECTAATDCQSGQSCVNSKCVRGDGGVVGGGTGAKGGGSATGGGVGGSAGGGAFGGGAFGGGAFGGGAFGGGAFGGGGPVGGGPVGGGPVGGGGPIGGGGSGPCGPGTCEGCCGLGFCVTLAMESNFACGIKGSMCVGCPMGSDCKAGSCVAQVCTPANCPTGCCNAGRCEAGTSPANCGNKGMTCQNCGVGNLCIPGINGNTCGGGGVDGGFVDAGVTARIGDACGSGGFQCTPPGQCLPPQGGFPDGYCTQTCSSAMPCPSGSTCATTNAGPVSIQTCLANCTGIGTQSTCRKSYTCAPTANAGIGVCRPSCVNGGAASCVPPQNCDTGTGLCK